MAEMGDFRKLLDQYQLWTCSDAESYNIGADHFCAALQADLSSRSAEAGKPVVKGLEWYRPLGNSSLSRADTILGSYRVWTYFEANGEWFWNGGNGDEITAASEQAAQAAAQADYEARIRSALSTPADIEPVAWPIATDDQVEALARECGWDNRKYMTQKDYSIWCERMRTFARLAVPSPPDWAIEQIDRLTKALEPFSTLQIPKKAQYNAGAYSIRHSDIEAARAALSSTKSGEVER